MFRRYNSIATPASVTDPKAQARFLSFRTTQEVKEVNITTIDMRTELNLPEAEYLDHIVSQVYHHGHTRTEM